LSPFLLFCFYCGSRLTRRTRTRDHKRPLSKGGSDSKRNIVNACKDCNCDKGRLSLEEFRLVMALRNGLIDPVEMAFPGEL
jgi:5-methylcytosine-specific restriction endonuclease McrA